MKSTESAWLDNLSLDAHWMPFTSNRRLKKDIKARTLVRAQGNYYTNALGQQIFDAFSGLWCCGLGHARQEISDAVANQAKTLDYSPAFQYAHPLSFELANRIVSFMPKGLDRVFFTNSGSEAADTAMKMARAYWRIKGMGTKTRFIGRERSYHGVNFGGMSIGGLGANRKVFGQGVDADYLPHTWRADAVFSKGQPEHHGKELADRLLDLIALHDASNIAAVFVEPFAGAGGVIVSPKGYLERLREICTAHNILLIFDEVVTGFGRCGAKTGAEFFGVTPDILNIAKQVTNGVIPLGAVVAKSEIYEAITEVNIPDYLVEFSHGYTYSAHPMACAAGLAALDVLEKENMIARVAELASYFETILHELKGCQYVEDIRNLGLACGISIKANPGESGRRPAEIADFCLSKGVLVRYAGDNICLAPVFTAERHELDRTVNVLGEALAAVA